MANPVVTIINKTPGNNSQNKCHQNWNADIHNDVKKIIVARLSTMLTVPEMSKK